MSFLDDFSGAASSDGSGLFGSSGLGGALFGTGGDQNTAAVGSQLGTGSVYGVNDPPADAGNGNSLWSAINGGLQAFTTLTKTATGAYADVSATNNRTGQPERTPDGRYITNIQGRPTALVPQQNYNVLLLILVAVGAVLLVKEI